MAQNEECSVSRVAHRFISFIFPVLYTLMAMSKRAYTLKYRDLSYCDQLTWRPVYVSLVFFGMMQPAQHCAALTLAWSPSQPPFTHSTSHCLFLGLSLRMLLHLFSCVFLFVPFSHMDSPWLPSCRFIINSSHFLKSLLFLAFTWPPSSYPFTHPLALLRLHYL